MHDDTVPEGVLQQPEGELQASSMGYAKGQARLSVLQALLSICIEDGQLLQQAQEHFPTLLRGASRIFVHVVEHCAATDVLFHNFRISVRGSIRRAPSVVDWLHALQLKQRHAVTDSRSILRSWNATAPSAAQLKGSEATAVRALLELWPATATDSLAAFVGHHGFEASPWTEEVVADRKHLPGHMPRLPSKAVADRLRVTITSCILWVEHVQKEHASAPRMLRKKLDKGRAEELSQQAAFVVNVAAEAQGLVALPASVVENEFFQRWINGEAQVAQEVVQSLQDRSERFSPRDLPCLASLMDGQQAVGQSASVG